MKWNTHPATHTHKHTHTPTCTTEHRFSTATDMQKPVLHPPCMQSVDRQHNTVSGHSLYVAPIFISCHPFSPTCLSTLLSPLISSLFPLCFPLSCPSFSSPVITPLSSLRRQPIVKQTSESPTGGQAGVSPQPADRQGSRTECLRHSLVPPQSASENPSSTE